MRRNASGDRIGPSDRRQERAPARHRLRHRAHCRDAVTEGERRNRNTPPSKMRAKLHRTTAWTRTRCWAPALTDDVFSDRFTGLQTAGRASLRGQPRLSDVPVRTELMACARMDRHGVPVAPGSPFGRSAYTQRPAVREALLTSGSGGQASWARRNDRGPQEAFFSSSARRARSSANAFSPASLAANSVLKSPPESFTPSGLGRL